MFSTKRWRNYCFWQNELDRYTFMVVSFLCTRVQESTREDYKKLCRVLGYLKSTQDWVLVLQSQMTSQIKTYVDAAFALHSDFKSHSGVVLYIGKTLVYAASKKQKKQKSD